MASHDELLMEQAKGDRFRDMANAWIETNPDAWDYMVSQARKSAANGKRFGIGALCEVVRWKMRNVEGRDGFKLNNNYRAAFARRLIEENPEVGPYISTRGSVCDL